ncbi:thioredoxin domain-containing protein [Corallococcus sp. bb12-1]|uniref:thioredoxin family protein n=1 Tax=Corallococcus sp. bb12-1 TaxID=2996784 RepID=UPI002271A427|nr:thioredoxin domain-containing protein [Corallococcus sp. bb12-1]MCY1041174.1 thioredoxin domain-containing protein [Corallococcus sp. bb12-1]
MLASPQVVLMYFWARWCPPEYRLMDTWVERVADRRKRSLKIVKVDVEEEPVLAERYVIRAVPTLLLFKSGQVVDRSVGAMPRTVIRRMLEGHL